MHTAADTHSTWQHLASVLSVQCPDSSLLPLDAEFPSIQFAWLVSIACLVPIGI